MTPRAKPPQMDPGNSSSHQPPSDSAPTVRILFLRDPSSPDASQITHLLKSATDLALSVQEVCSKDKFVHALRADTWDVILIDYQSNALTGDEALPIARSINPQTPLIVITHSLGEKKAVEILMAGAKRYILKDELEKLVPSITRLAEQAAPDEMLIVDKEMYRTIVQTAQEGIFFGTPDGKVTYANQRMAEMLGYSVKELLGKRSADLVDVDWQKTTLQHRQGLRGGSNVGGEIKFRRKDGSVCWSWYNATPVFNKKGEHVANFGMHTDITARKRAEQALQENEERLRLAKRAANVGIWDWHMDTGKIDWSPELEEIYGYAPGTFPGSYAGFSDHVHPEDLAEVERQRDAAVAAGQPFEFDFRVVLPSGGIRWVNCRGAADYDPTGQAQRVFGVNVDITERKRAAEVLAESERRYRGIIETAEEGIATHEADGTITYVNQRMADMLGYSREEIIGRSSLDFVDEVEREKVIQAREYLKDQGRFVKERRMRRKDGSILWTLASVSRQQDGLGNFSGYLAMHTDITERKRVEDESRKTKEELESLLKVSPAALFVSYDPACAHITGNPAAYRLVNMAYAPEANLSKSAPLGEQPPYRVYRDGVEVTAGELPMQRAASSGKDVYDDTVELRFEDGTHKHIIIYATPLWNSDGSIRGVLGSMLDISELKHSEAILKESEERFRSVLNASRDALYRFDLQAGRYDYISPAGEAVTGIPADEFMAMSHEEALATVHPDDIPSMRAGLARVFETGEVELEYRQRTRSGEYRWVLNRLWITKDADGRPLYRHGNLRDLTERKEAAERLEHIARFPEENPHPVMRVTPDGKLLYANSSSVPILNAWTCTIGQDIPEEWKQRVRRSLESGENENLDTHCDGRAYAFTIVPVARGPYVNFYGRDITEQRRVEADLRKTTQEKAEFFESIDSPFYGLDKEWRYTFVNEKTCAFMHKTPRELLGKTVWEVFPELHGRETERQMLKAMKERVAVHYETQSVINDIWTEVHIYPKADGGLSVLYRDITELKEAETQIASDVAALKIMHRVSQRVLETAPVESLFQEITDAAISMAKAQKGTLRLLEGERLRLVSHRGHQEPFLAYFDTAGADGPVYDEVSKHRTQVLIPDLEKSPLFAGRPALPKILESGVRAALATPLLNRSGELLGVLGAQWSEPTTPGEQDLLRIDLLARQAADLIEFARAREALRESEARFRIMADSTPVMIWVTNEKAEIELVNRAYEEFFGVMEAEVRPSGTWKLLVHPEDEESYVGAYMAAVQRQVPFDAEGRVKNRSGQWRWIHSYGAPRFSQDGRFLGHVGSSPDITEEKLAADALTASELNMRLMVNMASDAMMVVSPNGIIEAVSALGMRLLGYEAEDMIGKSVAEFAETFSRLDAILTIENLRMRSPEPLTTTARVRTKNGEQVWLSVTASFVSLGTDSEKYFVRFQRIDMPSSRNAPE